MASDFRVRDTNPRGAACADRDLDQGLAGTPVKPLDEYHYREPPRECSYLPLETASLGYRFYGDLDEASYDGLLERGWRRFSNNFFRPACPGCRKCRSLRVDVARFAPTKSQRRCLRRNEEVEIEVGKPLLTPDHLELFERYHADMHQRRGWPHREVSADEYFQGFLAGQFSFEREFRYYRGSTLVGVGLVDMTRRSSSSAYFYHAPEWRAEGPGVFSMLVELQFARQLGIAHHYLGYWIPEATSMAYKSQYGPHELLGAYVSDDESPDWQAP